MSRRTYSITFFVGNVATEPEFFVTRSGLPKWVFRLAVDRDVWSLAFEDNANAKPGADFFTVECIGERWADLQLHQGDLITVLCVPRSRDVTTADGERRVVTYFRAIQIVVVHRKNPPEEDLPTEVTELVPVPNVEALRGLLDEAVEKDDARR